MKYGCGGFLLSHTLPGAVPSAFTGLASRFGMGFWAFPRGYDHRKTIANTAKHASNDQNGLPAVFACTHAFWGCVGLVVVCIVVTSKQDSCLSCCLVVFSC